MKMINKAIPYLLLLALCSCINNQEIEDSKQKLLMITQEKVNLEKSLEDMNDSLKMCQEINVKHQIKMDQLTQDLVHQKKRETLLKRTKKAKKRKK